jgi:hypothetical protein
MQKKLHPAVLTVGIFQVLFGLLSLCCGGFGALGAYTMFNDPKFDPSKTPPPVTKSGSGSPKTGSPGIMEVNEELVRRVPSYLYEQTFEACANLFLGLLMLLSGCGLFFMQSWARWLSIFYAILHILKNIGTLIYSLVWIIPTMNAIYDEWGGAGNPQTAGAKVGGPIGAFLGFSVVLYPILVCILLLIPPVSRAFRGEGAADKGLDDFRDDYRDNYRDPYRPGPDDHYRPQ